MAMTTMLDLQRAPVESTAGGRGRARSPRDGAVEGGFADFLHEASEPARRPRPDAGRAPQSEARPARDAEDAEQPRARTSPARDEAADAADAADAAGTAEAAAPADDADGAATDEESDETSQADVDEEDTVVATFVASATVAAADAETGDTGATERQERGTAWTPPTATGDDSVVRGANSDVQAGRLMPLTDAGLPTEVPLGAARGSGFDLLTSQELASGDVQVETGTGDMMQRLQRALATGDAPSLDQLGRPLVPQVVRSLATLNRNGLSEMRVQLQPADLGEIELRVRATEGLIRGEVMVQNTEVKYLLDSQIGRLREALAAQGMQLAGLDVGVSDNGAFAREQEGDGLPSFFGGGAVSMGDEPAATAASAGPRRPQQLAGDGQVHWLV